MTLGVWWWRRRGRGRLRLLRPWIGHPDFGAARIAPRSGSGLWPRRFRLRLDDIGRPGPTSGLRRPVASVFLGAPILLRSGRPRQDSGRRRVRLCRRRLRQLDWRVGRQRRRWAANRRKCTEKGCCWMGAQGPQGKPEHSFPFPEDRRSWSRSSLWYPSWDDGNAYRS